MPLSPSEMKQRITDLEKQIKELQEDNKLLTTMLEDAQSQKDLVTAKTHFGLYMYAIFVPAAVILHTVLLAFGKPSPFSGEFNWFLAGLALLYLAGFVFQIALASKRHVALSAELNKSGGKFSAGIGPEKKT